MPGYTNRYGIEDCTGPGSAPGGSRFGTDRRALGMNRRNYQIATAALAFIAAPYAAQGFCPSQSDANYHQPGAPKTSPSAKPPKPVTEQATYPKSALTKIEILPSSIELIGPRYSQRLVVEGTFADGHQEDLTSHAQIVSSDNAIAVVDK